MKKTKTPAEKKWPAAWLAGAAGAAAIALALTGCGPDAAADASPPGMVLWPAVTSEATPETPESMHQARIAFGAHCVTCHGQAGDGKGPASLYLKTPPRDFTKLIFKIRSTEFFPSDLDIFRSITAGFPAYGMPSFRHLPEHERWALVHYVKKLGREGWIENLRRETGEEFDLEESKEIVAELMETGKLFAASIEPAPDADSPARGKALYDESCSKCHGETGRGDGPSAPTMEDNWGRPLDARDFSEAPIFRKGGWRLVDTVRFIQVGVGGTPMPSHPALSEGQVWDLAHYVHELGEKTLDEQ